MLIPDEHRRLDTLQEMITLEIQGLETYNITLGDIKWLADNLVKANDTIKQLTCTCKDNTIGLFPVLHKCYKCGFEGGFRQVHEECIGCREIRKTTAKKMIAMIDKALDEDDR